MISVSLELQDFRLAHKLASDLKTLKNSITKGGGNMAGFLGEIAAARVYGARINNTYDFDLLLPDGSRADVKTKRTTVPPSPSYECSVARFNTRQKCDVYIFTRLDVDSQICWVLGHYNKTKYFNDARYLKKGQTDGTNGFIVKADCYNMFIHQLEKPAGCFAAKDLEFC